MKASAIRHLAGAFNAPRVAAALFERTVQLWDGQTAQQISQFETVLSFGCHRLALSPSGEMCVAAAWQKGKRGGVTCYDAATGAVLWHRTDIRHTQSVRFSAAGNSIWCRLEEGRLQHLSASTGETLGCSGWNHRCSGQPAFRFPITRNPRPL